MKPYRPYITEVTPWPKARTVIDKTGRRHELPRAPEVWAKALDGHVRVCHKGQRDPKCPACRELSEKAGAA
jgi:hypothetical protein